MSDTISTQKSRMVTGLFSDRDSAEAAYQSVAERGYSRDDVNLVMSDEARKRHFAGDHALDTELGTKAAEGAGIGGAIGGTLGAVAAAIAAIGTSLVLPGLGLVVAGPIAAALAGAGAGGAAGGLLGALIGYGIPEERVKHYDEGIRNGGILMGVTPRTDEDAAHFESKFREHQGQHVIGTGTGVDTATASMARQADDDAYWREAHSRQPYAGEAYTYEDYAPAYRLGHDARGGSNDSFEASESTLGQRWDSARGASRLNWEEAKHAVRAAWNRRA